MDQLLFSVVISLLIYTSQSAPQFPPYPDYHYYRGHQAPVYPSQSNFPGYYHYQHPFAYDPYSNPFYIYNHLGTAQQKFPDSKSTPDTKTSPTETESISETRKHIPKSAPILNYARSPFPNIEYVPIYGRNLDAWAPKEIPVTVIVDENFEKSYNVPYYTQQGQYVRNYVELPKPSEPSSNQGSVVVKSATNDAHAINVHETPLEQSQYIQGAPILPNVASISTPQASIAFYPTPYQGAQYGIGGAGRDLGHFNVNEIPISAIVVDEAATDKNSEKEIKPTEEKIDTASPVISSKPQSN